MQKPRTLAIEQYWGNELGKRKGIGVEDIVAEETRGPAKWLNEQGKVKS